MRRLDDYGQRTARLLKWDDSTCDTGFVKQFGERCNIHITLSFLEAGVVILIDRLLGTREQLFRGSDGRQPLHGAF